MPFTSTKCQAAGQRFEISKNQEVDHHCYRWSQCVLPFFVAVLYNSNSNFTFCSAIKKENLQNIFQKQSIYRYNEANTHLYLEHY